jgi:Ribbon-helix-helix protein, copG family
MNDKPQRSERERRELAQEHAGEVVRGSGRVATPRKLGDMVSLRLEPELAEALRRLADRRGASVSELLREGAIRLLAEERANTASTFTWRIVSLPKLRRLLTTPTSGEGAASAVG